MAVDGFIPLFEANLRAVDRAARILQGGEPRWSCWESCTDLFEHAFWERLYGPSGDSPEDFGMIDWDEMFGYDEC